MSSTPHFAVVALPSVAATAASLPQPFAYAGQNEQAIEALFPEDLHSLLNGQGMGLAKVAELHGHAGAAHGLGLVQPLGLAPDHTKRTQQLFSTMRASAKSLGFALIEDERTSDALFGSRTAKFESLYASLVEIAQLRGALHVTRLEARFAQVRILTAERNEEFARLRGAGKLVATASTQSDPHRGARHVKSRAPDCAGAALRCPRPSCVASACG